MLGALFGFRGRLSRPGFWEVLVSVVLIDAAMVIGRMSVADSGLPGGLGPAHPLSQAVLQAAPWALVIFTVWSGLAASVKRCHDRGRTGLLLLVALIPVIGWLWLLIDLFFLEGTEGRNRYGKVPHGPDTPERARFDWSAEPAEPAPAPAYEPPRPMMPDPEPAFERHAPQAEAPAAEPRPQTHAAHAEAAIPVLAEVGHAEPVHLDEGHAAQAHAPASDLPLTMDADPRHDPQPLPELVMDNHPGAGPRAAPAEEPYDPLNAPLVLNLR